MNKYKLFTFLLLIALATSCSRDKEETKKKTDGETKKYLSVTLTVPQKNATNVELDAKIKITFSAIPSSEEIDEESINENSIIVKSEQGKIIKGKITVDKNTIIFTPDENLAPDTTYVVTVSKEIKSKENKRTLSGNYVFRFTTKKDSKKQEGDEFKITLITPTRDVSLNPTIKLKSTKPVDETSMKDIALVWQDEGGAVHEVDCNVELDGKDSENKTIKITPKGSLKPNTTYNVLVPRVFKSKDGVELGQDAIFAITTKKVDPEVERTSGKLVEKLPEVKRDKAPKHILEIDETGKVNPVSRLIIPTSFLVEKEALIPTRKITEIETLEAILQVVDPYIYLKIMEKLYTYDFDKNFTITFDRISTPNKILFSFSRLTPADDCKSSRDKEIWCDIIKENPQNTTLGNCHALQNDPTIKLEGIKYIDDRIIIEYEAECLSLDENENVKYKHNGRYIVQKHNASKDYEPQKDTKNTHEFTDDCKDKYSEDDHLGVFYSYPELHNVGGCKNPSAFYKVRWNINNPDKFPIKLSLDKELIKNVQALTWIYQAVKQLNQKAREEGIVKLTQTNPKGELVKLAYRDNAPIDYIDVHTITLAKQDTAIGPRGFTSVIPYNYEMLDSDITIFWSALVRQNNEVGGDDKNLEKIFKHVFLHELFHFLGIGHNFFGYLKDSLTDYYFPVDFGQGGILPHILSSEHDIDLLKYQYTGQVPATEYKLLRQCDYFDNAEFLDDPANENRGRRDMTEEEIMEKCVNAAVQAEETSDELGSEEILYEDETLAVSNVSFKIDFDALKEAQAANETQVTADDLEEGTYVIREIVTYLNVPDLNAQFLGTHKVKGIEGPKKGDEISMLAHFGTINPPDNDPKGAPLFIEFNLALKMQVKGSEFKVLEERDYTIAAHKYTDKYGWEWFKNPKMRQDDYRPLKTFEQTPNQNMDYVFIDEPADYHYEFAGVVQKNNQDENIIYFYIVQEGPFEGGHDYKNTSAGLTIYKLTYQKVD